MVALTVQYIAIKKKQQITDDAPSWTEEEQYKEGEKENGMGVAVELREVCNKEVEEKAKASS